MCTLPRFEYGIDRKLSALLSLNVFKELINVSNGLGGFKPRSVFIPSSKFSSVSM